MKGRRLTFGRAVAFSTPSSPAVRFLLILHGMSVTRALITHAHVADLAFEDSNPDILFRKIKTVRSRLAVVRSWPLDKDAHRAHVHV
jgi:hypothetical protein